MENSRSSETQGKDRLSELPDTVKYHILWFVPMDDVVRTTILSKRWKNFWTTTPFLNFDAFTLPYDLEEYGHFVNQFLFRWNGVRILKFRICYNLSAMADIDIRHWTRFARDKGVEEFYMNNKMFDGRNYYDNGEETWLVLESLCSSSFLKVLSIKSPRISRRWDQLKNLTISDFFYGHTEDSISRLFSGNPQLEVFNLSYTDRGRSLYIHSSSLKELSICRYSSGYQILYVASELTIWTPNLESLKMEGIPFGKCRLMNVSSLTTATLGFSLLICDGVDDCHCRLEFSRLICDGAGDCHCRDKNDFSVQDFLGDKFNEILEAISHAESITLLYCCPEVLAATKKRCTYYTSSLKVKSLTMRHGFSDYVQFVRLLEIFPRLEKLVLQDNERYYNQNDESLNSEAESYPKFEANNSKPVVVKLRAIDITWSQGNNIFPFIALLLKYASKLENMVFRVKEVELLTPLSNSLLVASQKLLRMPRSSPNCTIITTPYVEDND